MKKVFPFYFPTLTFVLCLLPFAFAHAHEVYVLPPQEIAEAIAAPRFSMIAVATQNAGQFIFWATIATIVIFLIFSLSIVRPLEKRLDPWLNRIKKYAPMVARVTVGLGLMAAAYYHANYGPELLLAGTFGSYDALAAIIMAIVGLLLVANIWTRFAAFVALVYFSINVAVHGAYMLTYTNYLGEIILLLIAGYEERKRLKGWWPTIAAAVSQWKYAILRVSFGVSLIYASFFAKILHNDLALRVASERLAGHPFALAYYFGLDPHFLVLGAAIIEILIGLFFVLGIEIRFTALFMEFWLILSLLYFGEAVWPHIILIGLPIALFMHGYDKHSLEGLYFKRGRREPVF